MIVDANRARAAQWAQQMLAPDLFILDDGVSHHKIERDLNWVMLAKDDCQFLVRRREPRSALRYADVIASFSSEPWAATRPRT